VTRRPRRAAGAPTRVVAYLRVSTDKQADRGVSLDEQRARVEAYASLYGLELVAVEVDPGYSASTLDRPGLQRALGMLRRGEAGALLVAKLDRLTRSLRDLRGLVDELFRAEGGAALLSVADHVDTRTPGGRLVLSILGTVATWEREVIAERTRDAQRHKRARGEYTGGRARYGYAVGDGGALVEVAEEQAALALARRLRGEGASLRAIARALGEAGHRSRTGRPFLPESVRLMTDTDHDTTDDARSHA
jgi:site-specific DNA recombinase